MLNKPRSFSEDKGKVYVNNIYTRSHAFLRCLVTKSIDEGYQYAAHNGLKLRPVSSAEIVVPQIFPYIMRLLQIEISTYQGKLFEAIHLNVDTSNPMNTVTTVTIDDDQVHDQLNYFTMLKYIFEFIFLKNKFNEDITIFTKACRYI